MATIRPIGFPAPLLQELLPGRHTAANLVEEVQQQHDLIFLLKLCGLQGSYDGDPLVVRRSSSAVMPGLHVAVTAELEKGVVNWYTITSARLAEQIGNAIPLSAL